MTTPYRIALLLGTGIGALCALIHAERDLQVYYDASSSNIWQPPLLSEFYLFGIIGVLLSLVFILLGFGLARHLRAVRTATPPRAIEKRNYLAVALLITLLAVWLFFPTHANVSGVQNGRPLEVSHQLTSKQLEMLAIRLLLSCRYEAQKDIATEARWQQALEKSHIHLVFAKPHNFSFSFLTIGPLKKRPISTTDILIPVSHRHGPDYVFVRDHGQIHAFAKYSWDAMADLQKLLPTDPSP